MKQVNGKTTAGFEYVFEPDVMNDMEFLESLTEVDENPVKLPGLISKVLGEGQKRKLYDYYRNESGRVPVDAVSAAFVEILKSSSQGKN